MSDRDSALITEIHGEVFRMSDRFSQLRAKFGVHEQRLDHVERECARRANHCEAHFRKHEEMIRDVDDTTGRIELTEVRREERLQTAKRIAGTAWRISKWAALVAGTLLTGGALAAVYNASCRGG